MEHVPFHFGERYVRATSLGAVALCRLAGPGGGRQGGTRTRTVGPWDRGRADGQLGSDDWTRLDWANASEGHGFAFNVRPVRWNNTGGRNMRGATAAARRLLKGLEGPVCSWYEGQTDQKDFKAQRVETLDFVNVLEQAAPTFHVC